MNRRKKLQNSSRRQKRSRDRISALPDSILRLILSLLTTKNVVATSILSKRWKSLWKKVENIDLCYKRYTNEEDEDLKFVGFVNRVLLLHDAGLELHKFRLVWKYMCIPSQVDSWISTAITRNVSQLFLSLNRCERMGGPFEIPTSVFTCDTLQSLVLKGIMWIPTSIVVCLPRLETLKLVSLHFNSEEAFQKIIRGCPILNYLHLHMVLDIHTFYYFREDDDIDRSGFRYIISSTSLRHLELDVICWGEPITCRLELEAFSLEYLKLNGFISLVFVQGSLSSLVEADLRNLWLGNSDDTTYNSVVEVVRAFDCAKSLTLSTRVMRALCNADICLSTKFTRLKKLVAGADCFYCSSLEYFIQSSDNLEVLTLYQDSIDVDDHVHSIWNTPLEVPSCLSNSLKVIVFDGYSGSDHEVEMISYMLKHGSALEVIQISFDRKMHGVVFFPTEKRAALQFELVREICKFTRKSPICKVEFFTSPLFNPLAGAMPMYSSD